MIQLRFFSFRKTKTKAATAKLLAAVTVNTVLLPAGITLVSVLLLFGVGTPVVSLSYAATAQSQPQAQGQDGAVDPTFRSGSGPNAGVTSSLVQPDGKILVAGAFTVYDNSARLGIARLHPNGTLDQTFTYTPGLDSEASITAAALQNDGKILLAGVSRQTQTKASVWKALPLVRLNSDGTPDTSFNFSPRTVNGYEIYSIAVQNDGKILIGEVFRKDFGLILNTIRLNTNGSLDPTFNSGKGANILSAVYKIKLQSDGKILIGGSFIHYNGIEQRGIIRLNTDGSLDPSFNSRLSEYRIEVQDVQVQSDGRILIGGKFTHYDGISHNKIVRLNTDGSLDPTFDSGSGARGAIYTVVVVTGDTSGKSKILIAGDFESYNNVERKRIARLNSDGSLDLTFDPGAGPDASIRTVAIVKDAANNKVLIVGNFLNYNGKPRPRIALLNADADAGSADPTFNARGETGASSTIYTLAVQTKDDKILIGGAFTSYGGVNFGHIGRLNPDGTPDPTFATGTGTGANGYVYNIVLHPNGKILISGLFNKYNGVVRKGLALLNSDGSLDITFNPNSVGILPDAVTQIKIQTDGKILYAGRRGNDGYELFRLNPDGSLDTTFEISNFVRVGVLEIQSDGKILVGGVLITDGGSGGGSGTGALAVTNNISRLNPDGSLDTTFNSGTGNYWIVSSLAVQPADGKILVSGVFDNYSGTPRKNIARLNPDGSLDTTFNPTLTGATNDEVWKFKVQPSDGKILIGGVFVYNSVENTLYNRIRRLNPDGSEDDATFDAPKGANGEIYKIDLQSNGKIIIGGNFTAVNNSNRAYIARLENLPASRITLRASPNPAVFGESVTFTATVTPITATGTVRFTFGGSTSVTVSLASTTSSGGKSVVATYVTNTLPVGITPVTAAYVSDGSSEEGKSEGEKNSYLLRDSTSGVYNQIVVVAPCKRLAGGSSPNPSSTTNDDDDENGNRLASGCGIVSSTYKTVRRGKLR